MGRSTPKSLEENRDVMRRVQRGEVSPHCQRARRASRMASKFPEWGESELLEAPRLPDLPPAYRLAPMPEPSRVVRSSVGPEVRRKAGDQEILFRVLFGSIAPQAEQAFNFLATSRGRKALNVGGVALGTLITSRMVR